MADANEDGLIGLPQPPAVGASALPAGTFDGVCVFVTGAGTGLGKAIASEFARLGASIVIASRKPEHLDAGRAAIEAIGAIDEGSRELLISTGRAEAGGVFVAVRDSGAGLSPQDLEHVFDAFYTTKSGGMGMGLAICRSIIEAHGGRVWATPNTPRGATFQFNVPASPPTGLKE